MKKLWFGIGAVATGALMVLGGIWVYATYLVPEAAPEFTLEPTASATTAATTPPPVESVPLDGTWEVSSGAGGYRVHEVLRGVDNTVVGRTDTVEGALTIDGERLVSGEITVPLDGIATDAPARDLFFRGHLRLSDFPNAEFRFAPGIDISDIAAGRISVDVPGALTLHGITRDELAHIDARREGDTVVVVGSIDVDYTNYDLSAPDVGFAVVEPDAVIEVKLTFEPAA